MIKTLLIVLLWILYFTSTSYAIIPVTYTISRTPLSAYGSSQNGNCSTIRIKDDKSQQCTTPQGSVLFDGIIPSLTGINNSMCWASQLLVIEQTTTITFEFRTIAHKNIFFLGIASVEVVMFNCPSRQIGTSRVAIPLTASVTNNIPVSVTSCNNLIKICASFNTIHNNVVKLLFNPPNITNFSVYLAEIYFHSHNDNCPFVPTTTTIMSSTTPPKLPSCTIESNDNNLSTSSPTNFSVSSTMLHSNNTDNNEIIKTDDKNKQNPPSSSEQNISTAVIVAPVATFVFIILLIVIMLIVLCCNKKIKQRFLSNKRINSAKYSNSHKETVSQFPDDTIDDKFEIDTYATVNVRKQENDNDTRHVCVKDSNSTSFMENNNGTSNTARNQNDLTLYAVVNKKSNKKNKKSGEASASTEMYAVVDKSAKKKAKKLETSCPDVSDMYAVVDKSAKKREKEVNNVHQSSDISDMYAVVDKKAKRKSEKTMDVNSPCVLDMYAVVDKKKKKKRL